MPPVMITKPWPMAKSPKRPTRFAVLARLIGDRNRGLMQRDDRADHQDQDQEPEVLLLHRRPSAVPDRELEHPVLGELRALERCR